MALGIALALADNLGGFKATHFRHHDIHEDHVVRLAIERRQRFQPIDGQIGAITHLLQEPQGDLLVDGVIIGEQHSQREAGSQGGIELESSRSSFHSLFGA